MGSPYLSWWLRSIGWSSSVDGRKYGTFLRTLLGGERHGFVRNKRARQISERSYETLTSIEENFIGKDMWGWPNYYRRSSILNEHLDDGGSLAIVVSIKREVASSFVPCNPVRGMITRMFLDEETADVCFEVSDVDANAGNRGGTVSSPVTFHAHHLILKACAPLLASLFGSDDKNEKLATASITDFKPAIFRHLLHYVYGGSVPDAEMKTHSKDIMNAANKYSIVNLKLEAEAAYVESTEITMDNAMDNLFYADAHSLALLKEVVMDFLTENSLSASQQLSFADVPGYLMKDVFATVGRKISGTTKTGDDDDLSLMRVGELRQQLAELGLDVDGSREAMIETLRANVQESADADEDDDSHVDHDGDGFDLLDD